MNAKLKELSKSMFVELEKLRSQTFVALGGQVTVNDTDEYHKILIELEMIAGDINLEITRTEEKVA